MTAVQLRELSRFRVTNDFFFFPVDLLCVFWVFSVQYAWFERFCQKCFRSWGGHSEAHGGGEAWQDRPNGSYRQLWEVQRRSCSSGFSSDNMICDRRKIIWDNAMKSIFWFSQRLFKSAGIDQNHLGPGALDFAVKFAQVLLMHCWFKIWIKFKTLSI